MKHYNEMSIEWERVFKTLPPLQNFIDAIISHQSKRPVIDLIKFDNYIQRMYPTKYDEELSLKDFLEIEFGVDAVRIVKELI